ncbi:uncharacterized protein LOC115245929, partial [Formica exsecta]|uniref:uncharacterized protein LOC115245929 n=1 Tax=Formica exsecta TaxID=72781 RepID=UPI00114252B1
VIYVLVLVLSLTQAEQENKVQKPEVTKLEVVNLDEIEVTPNSKQSDIQRKRNSGYIYSKPNHVSSNARLRFQGYQSRGHIVSKFPGQLSRPFTKYGSPNHSTSGPIIQRYRTQQHRNKLQHQVNQQQSISFHDGLVEQEVPSPIRNIDFAEVNPIASQNNEPFGMHTANYLPPQNQKLPAYPSTDNFVPQSSQSSPDHGQAHGINLQNQNLVQTQNHQISDAALFLSENAHAIQQLYGAPANDQNFAPNNDQFQDIGNQIQNLNDQFRNFESTSQSSQEFRGVLPSYASGTLNSQETLEQIQSLEKDRLIVQLQQALAQAQTTPRAEAAGRYAQNQASFIQNQKLLESISQQIKSQISTPQTATFGSENTAFNQSPFLPGTTVNPLKGFSFNYGVSTTTPITPTTTVTGISITRPSQASKIDGTTQIASLQPVPGSATAGSPIGIPVYGGFVPTFIAGTNLVPNYSTGIFTSKPVKPVQSSETSPTHFGIPIPTEPSQKPAGLAPSIPSTTIPSSTSSANQPGPVFTPVITPVTLPVQPIRPVAPPLHSLATPVHPVTSVLPINPQVYPAQVTPAVTSSVQHTYGIQNALINPVLYKPVKAVYPVYYYPNVAYQLQKPALPNYPWNYAPSYTQTKPT